MRSASESNVHRYVVVFLAALVSGGDPVRADSRCMPGVYYV